MTARASLSHEELAAELAGDTDEYRMELQVDQVAPPFRVASTAFLPIRPDAVGAVTAAIEAMPDRMHGVLAVRDLPALAGRERAWYAGLPATGHAVEVHHAADRSYAGYGNLYRAIGALAPSLDDARFFISEDYGTFVDEYRIAGGAMAVTRGFADEEYSDAKHAYYVALAKARPADAELRGFAAWQLAFDAGYGIPDREGAKKEADRWKGAAKALATAMKIQPDDPEVLYQHGRHARAGGDHEAAAGWFERAAKTGYPRLAYLRSTMAATALAAGKKALAKRLLADAADDRVAWMLRGHAGPRAGLADATRAALGCVQPGDRESIPWTGAATAILEAHARMAAKLVKDGAVPAATAARDLLDWAELYRIRTIHGLHKTESRAIADALYDAAAAIDPLGGDVAAHRVFHDRGIQGKGAVKGLTAVLDEFPDQPDALFWAASGLGKQEKWAEAVALWRRYDAASATRSSYERGTARAFLVDGLVRLAYARMLGGDTGAETEALIDEAIAKAEGWNEEWVGPYLAKADLYEYRRDHATALGHYDRAVEIDEHSAHVWSGRASCLNNLGRLDEALADLDKAQSFAADYWHIPYVRACTLAKRGGDRAEIVALMKRAVKLEPGRRAQILGEPDLAAYRADAS